MSYQWMDLAPTAAQFVQLFAHTNIAVTGENMSGSMRKFMCVSLLFPMKRQDSTVDVPSVQLRTRMTNI